MSSVPGSLSLTEVRCLLQAGVWVCTLVQQHVSDYDTTQIHCDPPCAPSPSPLAPSLWSPSPQSRLLGNAPLPAGIHSQEPAQEHVCQGPHGFRAHVSAALESSSTVHMAHGLGIHPRLQGTQVVSQFGQLWVMPQWTSMCRGHVDPCGHLG